MTQPRLLFRAVYSGANHEIRLVLGFFPVPGAQTSKGENFENFEDLMRLPHA